jgi:hypothetical protein
LLMESLQFDEMLEMEITKLRSSRTKPVKRMWREIEAIQDQKRLQRELMEMDVCFEANQIKL